MNNGVAALVIGGLFTLVNALLVPLLSVKVTSATAAKLISESEKLGSEGDKSKAEAAEVLSRIAGEWTSRILESNKRLDRRQASLEAVLERLIGSIESIEPLLSRITGTPDEVDKVTQLRVVTREARLAV